MKADAIASKQRKDRWTARTVMLAVVVLSFLSLSPLVWEVVRSSWARPSPMHEAFAGQTGSDHFDTSAIDALLHRIVDADGFVDYDALWDDPHQLDACVAALARVDFGALSRDDRLAFLLDAFNLGTIRMILDHWPLEDLRAIPEAQRWSAVRWNLGGMRLSLEQIERNWLRTRFIEPRIHFALQHGTLGDAPLRDEAYDGRRIEAQLADQTRRALMSPQIVDLREGANILRLGQTFLWYSTDFRQVAPSLLDWLRDHDARIARSVAEHGMPSVLWIDHDWRHNGTSHR